MSWISVESLAPLMFGSGRAFGSDPGSLQMKARPLPTPAALAGAVRSWVAQEQGWHDVDKTQELLEITVKGPFLERDGEPCLPAPLDAGLMVKNGRDILTWRKPQELDGVYLPEGLLPCLERLDPSLNPTKGELPKWWSLSDYLGWLESGDSFNPDDNFFKKGLSGPLTETRTHVGLDVERRSHRPGSLFSTQGSCFGYDGSTRLYLHFEASIPPKLDTLDPLQTLGGDRRPIILREGESSPLTECPGSLRKALVGAKSFRTILVTPGLFGQGWRPEPPTPGAELVGACVDRPEPLNRWRRTIGQLEDGSPKPQHWMAPAGSVYFWRTDTPLTEDDVTRLWLGSLSDINLDGEPASRLGFGLALLGAWNSEL